MCRTSVPRWTGNGAPSSPGRPPRGPRTGPGTERTFSSTALLGPAEMEWLHTPLQERGFSSRYVEGLRTGEACAP